MINFYFYYVMKQELCIVYIGSVYKSVKQEKFGCSYCTFFSNMYLLNY